MLPDRVSNPGPLTYESGALPIALRDSVEMLQNVASDQGQHCLLTENFYAKYNKKKNDPPELLILETDSCKW